MTVKARLVRALPGAVMALAVVLTVLIAPSRPRSVSSEERRTAADRPSVEQSVGGSTTIDPGGTTGPSASQTTIGAGQGGGSGGGSTRGGVPCLPGVPQVPGLSYSPPCVPRFTGGNGGATARGVTEDTIRIVVREYPETANQRALQPVRDQAGGVSPEVRKRVRGVLFDYLNGQYELYGRRVELVTYVSRYGSQTDEGQGGGREGACLDADVIANEYRAFGVLQDGQSAFRVFSECAAQRGLVVFDGASFLGSESFYRRLHPYVWASTMSCDSMQAHVAEYLGRRLANKPASLAGDGAMRSQKRTFGLYSPSGDPDCWTGLDRLLSPYGTKVSSEYHFTLDVSRYPDEAARAVIQMKAAGVTSVVLVADPVSVLFLTQSAAAQGWRPEWILTGWGLQDIDNTARLYEPSEVDGHMFGVTQLGPTSQLVGPASEAGAMYRRITGSDIPNGTNGNLNYLVTMFNLLQAAGPRLTAASIADGAWRLPAVGAPSYYLGLWQYAPAAGRGHTATQDAREVFWDARAVSDADGKAGAFVPSALGTQRFELGEWPTGDPRAGR